MILSDSGSRAQSDVLGVALLLGIVVTGVGIMGVVGMDAVSDIQDQVGNERAINSMTLFDSRAALVALGDTDRQSVSFGASDGSYAVEPDAGWLRISHHNYSGDGDTETVYNDSLGVLVYSAGGTEIAYQGGGVWRRGINGGSLMLSPPEFHYRGATLTLPMVRLASGSASGSDSPTAVVTPRSRAQHVFPDTSASPDGSGEVGAPYDPNSDGDELPYSNPIRNGTVDITVHSQYYLGWARYFNQRTEGDIEIYKSNQSVRLTLETIGGSIGAFDMPMEGNSLDVDGIADGHPISQWDMTLKPDPHFQNLHWSMYADEGSEQFETHIHSDSKCSGGSFGGTLDLSIYYYDDSGSNTTHEEWQRQGIDPDTNGDFDVDCSNGELTMNLQGTTQLTYDDIDMTGSSNKWYFGPDIKDRDVPSQTTSFDEHPADSGHYSIGGTDSVEFLMDHYVSLLSPSFDLVVTDGPGGSSRVDEGVSRGTLEFATTTSAQYLTYLHITENKIDIDLD